ncbi:ATP-binding cassette domain-containing protein [Clostridium botulinum C]|uniref:ATP-binding cassette domain-containing protein n=1 Tax=Clostridium botulinum TaxID=1491 RepID=UPI001E52062A|nr:ATP-binding cassette domain-containing protein [Clostridium botulinum]MCD3218130.1 ATP-binding cassette domain-containing protein [Clostridium botulinum C]
MILSINNLTKKYDANIAVNNLNIEFKKGINALLGANGAGKTTLMKIIVTALKPTEGEITLDGKNIVENEKMYRNMLGFLPQDFNGYPEFSAKELMFYMGCLKNIPYKEIPSKTNELLKLVFLLDVQNKKIKTFSGGMKRRLGIAQALLNNPPILLLDEPTAGLDPKERIRFRNIVSNLSKDKIIILSTHIISDIEHMADNLIVMKKGKVSFEGSQEEILKKLNGKVWECSLLKDEINNVKDLDVLGKFEIEKDGSILIRGLSDVSPHPKAYKVQAKLEDIFLNYFKGGQFNESAN